MVSWSELLVFSWTLYWGSFLSLPAVTDGSEWLLPALRVGSPTYGWRCVLQLALVLVAVSQVGPVHSHWVPLLWAWCACGVSSSYVFLWDGVTLWVNSVFLSLLIANEGLHCWLFLSVLANPFWRRVVVLLRPPWVCRHFLWLVAALLPGFSLSFAWGAVFSSTQLLLRFVP